MITEKVKQLDEKAMRVAKHLDACEKELVSIFEELGMTKGFLQLGFTSLHDYGVRRLKLSDATTCNIVAVARKTIEIPELKQAIQSGELSISKARKITPVLTKENKSEWIQLAKTSTSREIERAVAIEKPELLIRETVKFKAEDRLEFKVGISEDLSKKLARARDLQSQRTSKPATYEEVLNVMVEIFFEKVDPIRKAERAIKRAEKNLGNADASVPGQIFGADVSKKNDGSFDLEAQRVATPFKREIIHSALKHAVTLRDQRRCTYRYNDGTRCECTRWLDVHHIVPVSAGGKNVLENLMTFCRAHHQMIHRH